jgi:hypothetical protein
MVTSVCSCFAASPIVAAACVYSVMSKGRPGTDPGSGGSPLSGDASGRRSRAIVVSDFRHLRGYAASFY